MNRISRKKSEKYAVISNACVRDKRISLKAKGLLCLIMSLPENWDFSIKGLVTIMKEGKTSIYNTIQELKQYGYCTFEMVRDEKGVFIGNDYTFYEEPVQVPKINPHSENPKADNPKAENRKQISKDGKEIKNETSKDEEKELKEKFAEFVVVYKKLTGRAVRKVDTEFADFVSKHKDWKEVVPLLMPAIERETEARNAAKSKGEFFPLPKMLQTYLGKQRAWELYKTSDTEEDVEQQNKEVLEEQLLQEFFSTVSLEKEAEILGYNVDLYLAFSDEKRQNWRTAYRENFLDWIRENNE